VIDKFKPEYEKGNYKYYYCDGEGMPNYSDMAMLCSKLPNIYVGCHDSGMVCVHNMPCLICKTNHAVLVMPTGMFEPCWKCQEEGYEIVKRSPKNNRSLLDRFFDWMVPRNK